MTPLQDARNGSWTWQTQLWCLSLEVSKSGSCILDAPHLPFLHHHLRSLNPKIAREKELQKTYKIYFFESHDFFQGLLLRIGPTSLDGTAKYIFYWRSYRDLRYNASFTGCVPINKYDSMKCLCIQPHRKMIHVNTEFPNFEGYLHRFLRLLKTHQKKRSLTILFSSEYQLSWFISSW